MAEAKNTNNSGKFNILIVEDELLIAEMLSEHLSDLNYTVVGIAGDFDTAVEMLETLPKPDLCMLDINLESNKNGFDLATELQQKYKIPFVFLTSYADTNTITEAISYSPEAYLLKPFKPTDLFTTIEIIRNRGKMQGAEGHQVIVKDGTAEIKLNTRDIVWIKSDNIYVEVKLPEKRMLLRKSLDGILQELKADYIVRVHRSFAVNLFHLKAVTGSNLQLGSDVIPLSRMHRDELMEKFRNFNI